MRIIAGTARGRRLSGPGARGSKGEIRPTSDRAREAIFSVLGGRVAGARVLDLFAGTGAMGLEALSRGADSALFVDRGRMAIDLITRNVHLCGFGNRSRIMKRDLSGSLVFLESLVPAGGFSLVFADPPYQAGLCRRIVARLGEGDLMAAGGLLVAEAASTDHLPETAASLTLLDRRTYGEAGFWLYGRT